MKTKRKISLTIDNEIFNSLEAAAQIYNMAKSQIAQEALSLWLKKRTEELMAAGYEEMAKDDKDFVELTLMAQMEIFLALK
ncbi:MAG: hypothetical protein HQK72_02645 [Desulfamplus sp.]|nr:hypothetical protein [Desulfamplus sp.]